MKAILLAAGFGMRLRPITDTIPKCLVPVKNKPLMQYWMELLSSPRIDGVLINTHYLPHAVQTFLEPYMRTRNIAVVHEEYLLGTGGTVLKNRHWIGNQTFLLAHADNLTRFELDAFIEAHENRHAGVEITMMTFQTDAPHTCGIVVMDDKQRVTAFYEKSKEVRGTIANAAVYIMEPSVIDFMASLNKEIIDVSTEVLPHYLGKIQVFHNNDYHRDIGNPESLQMAEVEF